MQDGHETFRIRLFGYPVVQHASGEDVPLESAKVRGLLAYLAVHAEHTQSRDYMAFLLWPDVPNDIARKNLRQALYSLRKALSPLNECLDIQRHALCLHLHPRIHIDAWEFLQLAEQVEQHEHRDRGACPYCAVRYERMLHLYQGEFLQGFAIRDSVSFEEWLTEQREFFRMQALKAVRYVTHFAYLRGDFERVEHLARRWLRLDPWSDAAYGYLIRALALQGRKSAAWQAYHRFTRMMREELGLEPPPEAEHLMYDIQSNLLTPPASARWREHLPRPFPELIGREQEMDTLLDLLAHPHTRVVTLVGPGGIGKTRLALEAAHAALTLFPDGVYWIALSRARTRRDVAHALREALSIPLEEPGLTSRLAQWLEEKHALLVLDDVDGAHDVIGTLVKDVVSRTRHAVFLITARRPLRLRKERRFPLHGLAYPQTPEDAATVEAAWRFPAVRLFVLWARRIRPEFRITEANLPHVLRITQLAQGHPLALELAAGQMAHASCQEIEDLLTRAALDIETPYRDQTPHHRSLRVLLEEIWSRLPEPLQQALLLLAGFDAAFDTEMARAVAQVEEATLHRLADFSLLQPQRRRENGHVWWDFHPFTRTFLQEKRQQRPELKQTFQAKARPWLKQQLQDILDLPAQEYVQAMRRLGALQREMDAFLEHLQSLENGAPFLPAGIARWFRHQGRLEQGLRFFTRVAEELQTLDPSAQRDFLLGQVLRHQGLFAYYLGEVDKAAAAFEKAYRYLHTVTADDHPALLELGRVLQGLSAVAEHRGRMAQAQELEEQALKAFERYLARKPDPPVQAIVDLGNAYNNLGGIAYKQGDMDTAIAYYRQAERFYRRAGNQVFLANTLGNLAMAYLAQKRLDQAREACEASFQAAQEVHAQYPLMYALINMATIAMAEEDYVTAHLRLRRAIRLARQAGATEMLVQAWGTLGTVLAALQRPEEAEAIFQKSIDTAQEHEIRYLEVTNRLLYTQYLLERGEAAQVRGQLRQALEQALAANYTDLRDWGLILLADYFQKRGQHLHALALVTWLQNQTLTQENRSRLKALRLGKPNKTMRQQAERLAREATPESWLALLR